MSGKKVTGVVYEQQGRKRTVKSRKEVLLSGGTLESSKT